LFNAYLDAGEVFMRFCATGDCGQRHLNPLTDPDVQLVNYG
jgi:hypothetical protein